MQFMTRVVLTLVVAWPLLLPPGICVCHLFDSTAADEQPDDCECQQFSSQPKFAATPRPTVDVPVCAGLLIARSNALPHDAALVPPIEPPHHADPPAYLSHCALLF
jgi:hypothetical protein